MHKKIIGLIVACVLAVGTISIAVPASATPQPSTTDKANSAKAAASPPAKAKAKAKAKAAAKAKARAKAKAKAKAKARAAAAAKARAAARARANRLYWIGPRAVAAEKVAVAAQGRAAAAGKVAAKARARAAVTAKAAAAARAKAKALAKSKASSKVKSKAKASAKSATRVATKAKKQAAAKTKVANRAKAAAAAKARATTKARITYVAQAGPRARAKTKVANAARARAKVAATSAARARSSAARAAKGAAVARSRAVGLARSAAAAKAVAAAKTKAAKAKGLSKAKAKAAKAAKAAAVARAKAVSRSAAKAAKSAKAAARVAAKAKTRAQGTARAAAKAKASARARNAAAVKARKAAGPKPSWAPKESLIFNNPRGSRKRALRIITQLNAAIDATPAGGEIRMAQYLFDLGSVARKLIAAHRRGVSVKILIDDGETNKHIRKVRRALGTNKKGRSYVATCSHSCMSNGASVIHAKFYLFSVAGQKRHVSMISSANPYTGNTFNSWNNNHTIVGDTTIYNSLTRYFTDMLADRNTPNYFRVTTSGKYTMYLYPQRIRRPNDLVMLKVLNQTSCKTTRKGYGSDGRTLVRVANWGWTGSRLDIARRVWKLHDSGCKVQVMINKGRTSKSVLRVLLKRSKKHGQMRVYDAWYDANNNNVAGLYVHDKTVTISGMMGGKHVKIAWTGSQNFTGPGTWANNDIILRVVSPQMTEAYNRHFAYIRKHHTHRMRSVPAVARRVTKP